MKKKFSAMKAYEVRPIVAWLFISSVTAGAYYFLWTISHSMLVY